MLRFYILISRFKNFKRCRKVFFQEHVEAQNVSLYASAFGRNMVNTLSFQLYFWSYFFIYNSFFQYFNITIIKMIKCIVDIHFYYMYFNCVFITPKII